MSVLVSTRQIFAHLSHRIVLGDYDKLVTTQRSYG